MASAKSQHVSESVLEPFLRQSFDPAAYLNGTLPALSASSSVTAKAGSVPLAELSSQTQTLVSQLNAHTTRLTNALTQLTDDILRSGGRLAYQVELLRGETIGLSEALSDGLQDDLAKFGVKSTVAVEQRTGRAGSLASQALPADAPVSPNARRASQAKSMASSATPEHLTKLHTLTQVRERLDSVVKVFGDAMQWTIPPSELSLASALISVSAPEPGADSQSREEKGKEYAERIRTEIADLVAGNMSSQAGYDAASARIQSLRDLAQVWKGTSEEKARIKFVDSLVKLADDKRRSVQRDASANRQRDASPRNPGAARQNGPDKSFSLLDRLYLE